jgi:hypothetical protein
MLTSEGTITVLRPIGSMSKQTNATVLADATTIYVDTESVT